MMTYTFLVISEDNPMAGAEDEGARWHVGDIVDVELSVSQYDAFKAAHLHCLERYIDEPLIFRLNDASKGPDGRFMDRMNKIRHTYPGAKEMFSNTRWQPKREW